MVSACFFPDNVEEVYGTYLAEYTFGTEKLTLKSDGTYIQEVRISGNPGPLISTGKWNYDPTAHRGEAWNLYVVADGFGKLVQDYDVRKEGLSSFPVGRYFWSRRLRLGPDEGSPYNKLY